VADEHSRFWSYFVVAFLLLVIGAQAAHRFIRPSSAAASSGHWWAVATQALFGLGAGLWFQLKARRARRDD
jgi:hypothetical protein